MRKAPIYIYLNEYAIALTATRINLETERETEVVLSNNYALY